MTKINRNLLAELKDLKMSDDLSKVLKMFYNETSYLVFSYCRKKGLIQEDCEEIVQIVYTKIFNNRTKYNPEHNPLAWLYVITRSETKDYLKSKKIYNNYLHDFQEFMSQIDVENPSNWTMNTESVSVNEYFHLLNANEKNALIKRYSEDKDFDIIAHELNMTSTNVRKLISRAIAKIKKETSDV